MNRLVTFWGLTCVPWLWIEVTQAEFQTLCYQRQGDRLISPLNCIVEMNFENSENGLEWRIITSLGQVQQYRNRGKGIEVWNNQDKQWVFVVETNWFPGEDNILCWDDFCANWSNIPMD